MIDYFFAKQYNISENDKGGGKMARISVPLRRVDAHTLRRWLPERRRNSHKGDYGRLLLLCGSVGYTGAPVLAAQAAVRSGAGLVFSCVPEAVYPIVAVRLLEPMVVPLPSEEGKFSADAIPQALERLERCDACLIGCGMGQSAATAELVRAVLSQAHCPVVLDADGINALAGHIDVLRGAACPVIVTPHEGEFRRLFGAYTTSRLAAAKEFYAQTGATLLLKGHRSLIVGAEGCFENRCGNPGMATGGSGDVLAGIVTALLGQGLSPTRAAAAAAWLHGTAGDLCAAELGEYGMLPSDLLLRLPRLLR